MIDITRQNPEKKLYFGKYQGTVFNNFDPEGRGRITALVPAVLGADTPTTWCEACVPLSGPGGPLAGAYFVPPRGTAIWVEFEFGNTDYPIFAGCRYGMSVDVPVLARAGNPESPNIVLQTSGQNSLVISDFPGTGSIMLKSSTGATLIINDTGILIQNGKGASISLNGPTVSINTGALVVT